MSDTAGAFEAHRDRLRGIAHRVLGSHADAEDVVQEAWLRLSRQDAAGIDNLGAWLTTVVGRLSLDVLRARQARPESSYDLVVTADDGPAPEDDAALADTVGLALLVVLDSLRPGERMAFVLHDLFAVPFDEIGRILGKSTDATKMLASRARKKVRAPAEPAAARAHRAVVDAFLAAARHGDFDGLLRVLDPEVKLTADTPGGVVVVLGATKVAAGAQLAATAAIHGRAVRVNDLPGTLSWREDGSLFSLIAFTVTGDRITEISILSDPTELAALDLPSPSAPEQPRQP
ncbi:sigma-70 family RNA polymerase sigma factor [Actinokineospora auranticolor]|uniref:RNA polymerase sigma-70 factor (ECF subfamily) n=1 Tax=Actinokineospora auranticolor TaxID=155976 RepID=A0A2S6GS25_9PSEU|nr:sigma-70 family RNA polymerase sigma factor [Actinokineospora auranticolor]PPK68048.1 RNA polymerase sigma-70 factor (ECF subfamily) [Actinokineospora auranticolor]